MGRAFIEDERTLLDGLMAPQYCGDFAEVLHAFELRAPQLNVERIIDYAMKLDAATAKRLGWILARQGIASDRLELLRAVPIKGYRVPVDLVCERHIEREPHPGGQEAFDIRARFPWHRQPQANVMIPVYRSSKTCDNVE